MRLEDPVIVNMEHPVVKAFYKGKDVPCALIELPENLRAIPEASTSRLSTEPGADEASSATEDGIDVGNATEQHSTGELDSPAVPSISAVNADKTNYAEDRSQTPPTSPEEDDSFLDDLLEDTWQPSTCHEGTRYATVTPLSIRLALTTAQQISISQQATTTPGSNIRADLDPRLKARTPQDTAECPPSLSEAGVSHAHRKKQTFGECREEFQNAREEIRAKDRRIRELELALHESEGWTDAVTYRGGQKRPRL